MSNSKSPSQTTRSRNKKKTVLLVDDHPTMREGMLSAINQSDDLRVCGQAESASRAMAEIAKFKPDMVLVDISLQNSSGLELIEDIQSRYAGLVPTIVLSLHDETLYAERALHAGARGYIMKQESMRTVLHAIRKVLAGGIYLSDQMTARVMGAVARHGNSGQHSSIESLSGREREVFRLVGEGHAIREVATALKLSKKTVSCYQQNIRKKLNLKNATELVRHAVFWVTTSHSRDGQGPSPKLQTLSRP